MGPLGPIHGRALHYAQGDVGVMWAMQGGPGWARVARPKSPVFKLQQKWPLFWAIFGVILQLI